MKTIILEEPGRFAVTETHPPEAVSAGEALVRVRCVGICGTDLHAYRGRQPFFSYPRILGHELGVEIVALGEGAGDLKVGDRCAVEPYLNCGTCIACRRGKTNCCVNLKVLGVHTDGGMRPYIKVPASKLHASRTLSLEQLALVETLGIGAHAVDRAGLEKGENVLVIGAGPIGLGVIQFARASGARVMVLDVNEDRLALCRERVGVEHTVPWSDSALSTVAEMTDGDLPTAVFDATGNPDSMMSAFKYAANGGRVVYVGLFQGDVTFHDPEFHRKELTLFATRNSRGADFRRIIGLLESGQVDTDPWVTHRAKCDDLIAAFPGWLDPAQKVLKAVVEF